MCKSVLNALGSNSTTLDLTGWGTPSGQQRVEGPEIANLQVGLSEVDECWGRRQPDWVLIIGGWS